MTLKNAFVPPQVGDIVTFRKTMTVAEQAMFTGISGHLGGLYVDRTAAKVQGLPDMAVFELAVAALFSTGLARLAGTTYRIGSISFGFERAVPVGSSVEARVELVAQEGANLSFTLAGTADGQSLCAGEALLVPVSGG